jgi:hypothetical protein
MIRAILDDTGIWSTLIFNPSVKKKSTGKACAFEITSYLKSHYALLPLSFEGLKKK